MTDTDIKTAAGQVLEGAEHWAAPQQHVGGCHDGRGFSIHLIKPNRIAPLRS